jgi:sugar lactone lactonase YvrE
MHRWLWVRVFQHRVTIMAIVVIGAVGFDAHAQSILTVAGGGSQDGRAATQASIAPVDLAMDVNGNVFIADQGGWVRRIDAKNGTITTVAGTGAQAFSGDNGPAILAGLNNPQAIAIDQSGSIYIADASNRRIRKIAAGTFIITTIVGNGTNGNSGDGGPATAAAISYPVSLAVDASGHLYIGDQGALRIRRVDLTTGVITTFAGNGSATKSGDGGPATAAGFVVQKMALDHAGNLYISDPQNRCIRKVTAASGVITTYAGNGAIGDAGDAGPAVDAGLYPFGIAIDGADNLYVTDPFNSVIRKVNSATTIISRVAGTTNRGYSGDGGPALAARIWPSTLASDASGNLIFVNVDGVLRRIAQGTISTFAGINGSSSYVGDGGLATNAGLETPTGVARDSAGNLYIADYFHGRVRKVSAATAVITTAAGTGVRPDDPATDTGDGGPATHAIIDRPAGVAIDSKDNLYIVGDERVRKVDAQTGIITTVAGTGVQGFSGDGGKADAATLTIPNDVEVDRSGNLYIADLGNLRVRKVDAATGVITTIAGNGSETFLGDGPATATGLDPSSIAIGPTGDLYIADAGNDRVYKLSLGTGALKTIAGNGKRGFSGDGAEATSASLNVPYGIAVDTNGNVYVADTNNNRIRRIDGVTNRITTIAGVGPTATEFGVGFYSGDGGAATGASLASPQGIDVNAIGDVFVADAYSNRVRAVFACRSVGTSQLTAPPNDASLPGRSLQLSWSSAAAAFRYDVYLGTSNPPPLAASDVTSTTFNASNLQPATTYYWRVTAKGDPYCPAVASPSEIRSFVTATVCNPPSIFNPIQPAGGATGVNAASTELTWQAATGAATYDVYFGAANPPAFLLSTAATSATVRSLPANTKFYWQVVAHAKCDATNTTAGAVTSFETGGSCALGGAFTLTAPAKGAANIAGTTTLQWSASANAASYDLRFGTSDPPPLYLRDTTATSVALSGLASSQTYYWNVLAKVACDPSKSVTTSTSSFRTAASCPTPGQATIVFVPPGNVAVGQYYNVVWQDVPELGSDGYYVVERSTTPGFATIIDSQQAYSTSASFISSTAGTYYHRVKAISACDPSHPGASSSVKSVTAVAGTANVIFTVQPKAEVTAVGDKLEGVTTRFTLENLGATSLQLILGKSELSNSAPFFTIRDPLGGDAAFITLLPRTPKSFDIRFSGPPADQPASYQGVIFVAGQGLAIVPYAFVNLKIGGGSTSKPVFVSDGSRTEYAFFPGFAGDDSKRSPLNTVTIRNDGSAPMELAAEIGPEVWLVPEAGWNSQPIAPGTARQITFRTVRFQAPNGSALPRYTYFTVRSKSGETARLLVQDNDAPPTSLGRTSISDRDQKSFITPGVTNAKPHLTRLRMTNTGSEPVQTDLFFTPDNADGFSASVKRATVVVPPNDVVTLTDPLSQIFAISNGARGSIEVRAPIQKFGSLIVSASVTTPVTTGGSYGYEMPVLVVGEGARLGNAQAIVGVGNNASSFSSLTLVETSGIEATRVRAILFDGQGNRKGERVIDVPRDGEVTVDDIMTVLGAPAIFEGGRIELDAESGGGSVAAAITILDATRSTGVTLVSQPLTSSVSSSSVRALARVRAASDLSVTAVAPVVSNGRGSTGVTQRTMMGFTITSGGSQTGVITFHPADPTASSISKTVQIPASAVLHFDNVMEQLFGLPSGQTLNGSVFVAAGVGAKMYARVQTLSGATWSTGTALPIISPFSDVLSSLASRRPLYLDGLEQSIDSTRGTRWSVAINEIGGKSGVALVQLYEAGNRSVMIAEKRFDIAAYQQLQLDNVFATLGLDSDDRRKDRTNVLCVVSADSGSPLLSAVGISLDNQTGGTQHFVFSPTGGVPATGVLRVDKAIAVLPSAITPGRRRTVKP